MFVLSIIPDTKEVVVGTRAELFDDIVIISGLNWLGEPIEDGTETLVQLRYRAPTVLALVSHEKHQIVLRLKEAQAAVTPGQSAVLFDQENRCLIGGGTIVSAHSSD
jgi:tRNA U34 2-thiouridine synthase MnmA/TrmU